MRVGSFLIVGSLFSATLAAQAFPPGYVDPAPLLAAASKEIGEANLKCVTISGPAMDCEGSRLRAVW
jgi:hypothetical protein